MADRDLNTALCTYLIKAGSEDAFLELLQRHWPQLNVLGLVTAEPSRLYRGQDQAGKTFFVEIFTWRDAQAVDLAHQSPEVMAIWEPMGALVEDRGGRPGMDFPHVEPVPLDLAGTADA